MKKIPSTLLILTALTGLAVAQQNARLIEFESKSYTGDLRNGPYTFTGSAQSPVKASVSTLKINAMKAVLSAPSGTPMTEAQGRRSAEFEGTVTVTRGRLAAKGTNLSYQETSGVGTLRGGASAVYRPDEKDKDGDPVNITADAMSFDVDTAISTSRGGVKFVNGNQTGSSETMVFDENKELGLLTGDVQMSRAARGKQPALNIVGTEARVLTEKKILYVKGKVKLVSGDITSTGDAIYYDDERNRAVIVGNAVSVDAKKGTRVVAPAIEQRTDLSRVQQLPGGFKIPTDQFRLSNEK